MRYIYILVAAFLLSGINESYSQGGVSFQKVKEFYLHGDTRVIGNSILGDHKTRANNKPKALNDRTEMQYVDVDNDKETFSSSSANLSVPEDAKIVYAGLYWAATYPGSQGKQRVRNRRVEYTIKKKRDRAFDLVKLKIPEDKSYTTIQGELIYDGMLDGNTDLKNAAPYVCYSDITELLQAKNVSSGTYTLANVTALEGIMYGGSSAGWMLYVVYEQEQEPLQYMTSYQGFRYISPNKAEELRFNNFRVREQGEVKTSVTLAALEGDLLLNKDAVSIFDKKNHEYSPLKSRVRFANNFFNSSITLKDKKYLDRNPASINTLGFDLTKIEISNKNNRLIENDATEVKLEFKTEEDRFFIFFTAFQTEISTAYYQRVVVEGKEDLISADTATTQAAMQTRSFKKAEDAAQKEKEVVETQVVRVKRDQDLTKMLNAQSITVPEAKRGYYVVNHVFSKGSNAAKWAQKMERLGFAPQDIVRPLNGYHYIYIDYSEDPDALYQRLKGYRKMKDLKNAWILKVNLD